MADYSSSEVKSGVFISVTLILLLALTFVVGQFSSGKKETYQIRFSYISGLEANAPVYYSGHEAGKVERIDITAGHPRPVVVTVSLPDGLALHGNTEVHIDTLGLMGEKFVELTPGTPDVPVLAPGSVIEGTDPIPMYLLIEKMNLLADRMDELTVALNPMMEKLDHIVAGGEEDIAKIIVNLEQTSANVRDMTNDLKFRPWRLVRKD